MKRLLGLIFIVFLSAGLAGFSLFRKDENIFLRKGSHTWVKLEKADKSLRGSLDHPAELTEEQIQAALGSVTYFREAPFSLKKDKGREFDLLKPEEIKYFAPHLAKALRRATPEQWVDFSLEYFRGQGYIGKHRITSGVMFIRDGELNIAFRDIASAITPEDDIVKLNPLKSQPDFERIIAKEGQRLAVTQGRRKEVTHGNWLLIPVDSLAKQAAQIKPGTSGQVQPAGQEKSAKERLLELRELYDEGLITGEEYEEKRQEILEEI
jgi:hypothetical protein